MQQLNKEHFYLLLNDIDTSRYWELAIITGGRSNYFTHFRIELRSPAKDYAESKTELVYDGKVIDFRKKEIIFAKYKRWATEFFSDLGLSFSEPDEIIIFDIRHTINVDGIEKNVSESIIYKKNNVLVHVDGNSYFDESSLLLSEKSSDNTHWIRIISYDKNKGIRLVEKAVKKKIKELKIYHKQYLEILG